jgi:hypothetical protein
MTKLNLDEIMARCEAATPGPWVRVDPTDKGQEYIIGTVDEDEEYGGWSSPIITCDSGVYGPRPPDAEFICHARTDIPALVERVRELEVALSGLLEEMEHQMREGHFAAKLSVRDQARRLLDGGK